MPAAMTPEEYVPPEAYHAQPILSKPEGEWLCSFAQLGQVCPMGKDCPRHHDRNRFFFDSFAGRWYFGFGSKRLSGDHGDVLSRPQHALHYYIPAKMRARRGKGKVFKETFDHDVERKCETRTILLREDKSHFARRVKSQEDDDRKPIDMLNVEGTMEVDFTLIRRAPKPMPKKEQLINNTITLVESYGGGNSLGIDCLLYTSPSPRDQRGSRMPSSA